MCVFLCVRHFFVSVFCVCISVCPPPLLQSLPEHRLRPAGIVAVKSDATRMYVRFSCSTRYLHDVSSHLPMHPLALAYILHSLSLIYSYLLTLSP
jgi:hypothetical protein